MSVYPLTLGDIYVGIPFNLGRHICRLTSKRVNSFNLQLIKLIWLSCWSSNIWRKTLDWGGNNVIHHFTALTRAYSLHAFCFSKAKMCNWHRHVPLCPACVQTKNNRCRQAAPLWHCVTLALFINVLIITIIIIIIQIYPTSAADPV